MAAPNPKRTWPFDTSSRKRTLVRHESQQYRLRCSVSTNPIANFWLISTSFNGKHRRKMKRFDMTTNSIPDLCELSVSFLENTEDPNCLDCFLDLRISNGEIPLGEQECKVSFGRLFLSVDTEGMEVLTGSRFGEPTKKNEVMRHKATTSTDQKKSSSSLKAFFDSNTPPQVGLKVEQSKSSGVIGSDNVEEKEPDQRVKARPNLRWEVSEPNGEPLDGTYMENESLFTASMAEPSNRRVTSIELKVKQRDLVIDQIVRNNSALSFFSSLTENQQRLIDIFIAKSLSEATYGDRKYTGEIVLSEFEYSHES
jgi:hypothetical protein